MIENSHEEAVSEVIGAVLLVGLTVLGVAIVAAVLLSGSGGGEIPHAAIVAGENASSHFVLVHEGGDPLEVGEYRIYVDNGNGLADETANFTAPAAGVWSIGENITYKKSGSPDRVVVTAVTGSGETILAEPAFDDGGTAVFSPDPVDPGTGGSVTPVPTATPEPSIIVIEPPIGDPFDFVATGHGEGGHVDATIEGNVTSEDVTRVDLVIYPYNDPTGDGTKEVKIYREVAEGMGIFSQNITFTGNAINDGDPITLVFLLYNETSLIGVEAMKTVANVGS